MAEPEPDLNLPPELNGTTNLLALLGQQIVFLGAGYTLLYIFARDTATNPAALFGDVGIGALIGIGLTLAIIAIVLASSALLPRLMGELEDQIIELYNELGLKLGWPAILAISLAAGICEEMLFRAGLMTGLLTDLPGFAQVLISALIFGIMHAVNRLYFAYASVMGLIFGVAYLLTGSLLGVIIAHIIYDIWALRRLRPMLARNDLSASPTSHSP